MPVRKRRTCAVLRGSWAGETGCRLNRRGAPERAGHHDHQAFACPRHHRCATRLYAAPVRGGGAHRGALFGGFTSAGGDGRRTAREYAGAVGSACDTIRMLATSATVAATDHGRRAPERAAEPSRHIATIERACARRRRGCGFVIGACDDGARGASTISGETPFANNPESVYPVYPPY